MRKAILITYNTETVNLPEDGDLFGYIRSELDNRGIIALMEEIEPDPRVAAPAVPHPIDPDNLPAFLRPQAY